jgi:hypothetical protein
MIAILAQDIQKRLDELHFDFSPFSIEFAT